MEKVEHEQIEKVQRSHKGVTALASISIAIVVLVVVLAVGGMLSQQIRNQTLTQSGNNISATAVVLVDNAISGLAQVGQWVVIVVIVLIGAYLICVVSGASGGGQPRG